MIQTRQLSHEDHLSYCQHPMRDVTADPGGAIAVSPYLAAIPRGELRGATLAGVAFVYRDGSDRFDHVHFATDFHETYLVLVVDRQHWDVAGHHFLDLPRLYDLPADRLDD